MAEIDVSASVFHARASPDSTTRLEASWSKSPWRAASDRVRKPGGESAAERVEKPSDMGAHRLGSPIVFCCAFGLCHEISELEPLPEAEIHRLRGRRRPFIMVKERDLRRPAVRLANKPCVTRARDGEKPPGQAQRHVRDVPIGVLAREFHEPQEPKIARYFARPEPLQNVQVVGRRKCLKTRKQGSPNG